MLLEIILAIIPIAWLIISMAGLKMAGYKSCGIGLVIAIVEGVAVYHMTVPEAITGTLEGVVSAVWPICVIIVGAMFLYNMSLRTGAMDVIKAMLASVSNDKRVAALVIGWGFSNFMEGIAGFGTAVAIPAAMLVALGFNPVTACVICLIGNAASLSLVPLVHLLCQQRILHSLQPLQVQPMQVCLLRCFQNRQPVC